MDKKLDRRSPSTEAAAHMLACVAIGELVNRLERHTFPFPGLTAMQGALHRIGDEHARRAEELLGGGER